MALDGFAIRRTLLEVCRDYEPRGAGYFQSRSILKQTAQRLAITSIEDQQGLLTAWSDLFRLGIMAWGYNLDNAEPPHIHLTATGRTALSRISRDPYNPEGYLKAVLPHLTDAPVARSYLEEALNTFLSGCLKATAVMVGAAAESLVLGVRDALAAKLGAIGTPIPSKLTDWKVKTVRDAIETEIESRKAQLDRRLYERFSGFWVSISDQMRIARNDAGHPVSVDPVTHDTVHAALLLFPELASLAKDLTGWISTSLT